MNAMNRPRAVVAFAIAAIALSACGAGVHRLDTKGYRRMQAHEVANAVASSADGRLALGPGVIVHLPAGQLIPVKVEADVPLATLVAGQNQLRLKRDLYLLLTPQGQIELSPDGQSWASVAEPRAIARLFHTPGRGSFRVGVGAKRGEGVFIEIGVHKPAPAAAPAH